MSFAVPAQLEAQIDELISHYPQKRSASLMLLHTVQEQFGFISREAVEWIANKLSLQPINIQELVTFYPMLRQQAPGKYQVSICRTLSCALAGSHELHAKLCQALGLDPHVHGPQTTPDGKYTVEFVECLASCGTGPAAMVNGNHHEKLDPQQPEALLQLCK